MFQITRKEMEWGGRRLVLETGKVARQADGAVVATYGETSVLCTVVAAKEAQPGVDFFPLSVHYQERAFAAGKIPGGYFKREGKPSEREVLTSRLIDRPIRPLFPDGFRNETQVVCTLLSYDLENDPDIVAMIGASAALAISGVPFLGPIAGVRVGYKDNQYVLNMTNDHLADSALDLVVAGTSEGVLMVESMASELSEEVMLGAVTFGHESIQGVIKLIEELKAEAGKPQWTAGEVDESEKTLFHNIEKLCADELRAAYQETLKQVRYERVAAVRQKAVEAFHNEETSEQHVVAQFKKLEMNIVRGNILDRQQRIDGRAMNAIRPILADVGVLPRTHGSALFTRGETQALVVATLGTNQDEQLIDALEGDYRERFMLHYNFPPYSVGETGRVGAPGRREIGHGKLAWRAVRPLLPGKDRFPYCVRVVSEITESNGSSSMATVCGSSLAMMDAGVPLERPIAGIAMGLVKEGDNFQVLSDILGDEDHLGDMDFKVAGTENGVTALQMDIKVTSITPEIMKIALNQAKEGRMHILGEMQKAITTARTELSSNAPRIVSINIPKDKIRDVIGTGGKVIREICETTKTRIEITDDGKVDVAGTSATAIDAAIERIRNITAEPEVGAIYKATVAKLSDFGAFVTYMGDKFGLVHISQLAAQRVEQVSDVVKVGDPVYVKLMGFDDRGKARLSMKVVDQATGQELEAAAPAVEA